MEQVGTAIADLQAQVNNLSGTVANLETMRLQLSEIDLPGLATRVHELLNMREQLGSDLPGLVNTVQQLHAAHTRREQTGDRFSTGDDYRQRKPINEQKEKMLALPELNSPESWAAFRTRTRLLLDGRWDFAAEWMKRMASLKALPSAYGHCDAFATYCQVSRDEYQEFCRDIWLILAAKATGPSLNIINAQYNTTTGSDSWLRGPRAWYELTVAASGRIDDRCIALGNAIHQPETITNWADVHSAILNWESQVQEYTELTGGEIADGIKISCVLRLVPRDLCEQTSSQHGLNKVYDEVRAYLLDQVSRRRGLGMLNPKPAPPKVSPSGVVPMELGHLSGETTQDDTLPDTDPELLAFGKGKGKGKSSFSGQCYHCQQRGHRAAECPHRANLGKGNWQGKGGGKATGKGSGPSWNQPQVTTPFGGAKAGGKGNWIWQPAHSLEHAEIPGSQPGVDNG